MTRLHLTRAITMVRALARRRLWTAAVIAAAAALAACRAEHRDVSAIAPYNSYIGQVCEVLTPLRAHGYTFKLEREKKTDGISIRNPGFTGPEMTFLVLLQPGTRLTLHSAREYSNCPFDRDPEYVVTVFPKPSQFGNTPAYLRDTSLKDGSLRCVAVSGSGSAAR